MDTQVEVVDEALVDAMGDTLGKIKTELFFGRQWLMWRPKNTINYNLTEVKA